MQLAVTRVESYFFVTAPIYSKSFAIHLKRGEESTSVFLKCWIKSSYLEKSLLWSNGRQNSAGSVWCPSNKLQGEWSPGVWPSVFRGTFVTVKLGDKRVFSIQNSFVALDFEVSSWEEWNFSDGTDAFISQAFPH